MRKLIEVQQRKNRYELCYAVLGRFPISIARNFYRIKILVLR